MQMAKGDNSRHRTTYLVGGAVRDTLLGRKVTERDWVVTNALPEDLEAEGFRQVGKNFPVFISPDTGEEYALARTERKTGKGHTGFICEFGPEVTIEEDLSRRDLTINAIARDVEGHLIDPWGGQADLSRRVLRHVSQAFVEDPLRVLRVARFAAQLAPWKFQVVPETRQLLERMVRDGELFSLTPERIWLETKRALASPDPNLYFSLLGSWGALKIITAVVPADWNTTWGAQALVRWFDSDGRPPAPEQVYALLFVGLYGNDSQKKLQGALSDLQNRLKLPNRYHHLARKVACLLNLGARPDADQIAEAFTRIDLYRNPQGLKMALIVSYWLAEVAGWHWSVDLLQRCAGAARATPVSDVLATKLQGADIQRQLMANRHAAIAAVLDASPGSGENNA